MKTERSLARVIFTESILVLAGIAVVGLLVYAAGAL